SSTARQPAATIDHISPSFVLLVHLPWKLGAEWRRARCSVPQRLDEFFLAHAAAPGNVAFLGAGVELGARQFLEFARRFFRRAMRLAAAAPAARGGRLAFRRSRRALALHALLQHLHEVDDVAL